MKVVGLTAMWCGKCDQAKERLKDYPIEWIDIETAMGQEIVELYNTEEVPIFIVSYDVGDIGLGTDVIHSVLGVKELYEENPIE